MDLRQRKQSIRIFLDSCSDLLISKDIDGAEFGNALEIEDLDNSPRESTLWSFLGPFHKHEYGMGLDSLVQFCTELRRETAYSEMAKALRIQ